jgi:methionyl-tRNA synthetase
MYTTVLADVIARYRRMMGQKVYFLTGTDEHGQKIEREAARLGVQPKVLSDKVMLNFRNLWEQMGITNDYFIRTTDEKHKVVIQNCFERLLSTSDIYKAKYKGLYSVSDEAYVTETQANDLRDQGMAHQLIELEEESYFFRLSAYENWLIQLYQCNPEFVQPDFRLNEVKQFVSPGGRRGNLQDLSISRTSITWGIPVPGDEAHVIYVWFDALLNYYSACKEGFWPPSLQLVGKDILRFHAIYWPAFLMAIFKHDKDDLNGPLPQRILEKLPHTILAHGWWLMGNDKVSKSRGNVIRPEELLKFGNDAVRFFFVREMQVGSDRSFSLAGMVDSLNADLANGLGNLASRTLSMLNLYRGGVVPEINVLDAQDQETLSVGRNLLPIYLQKANANNFHGAINHLWEYLRYLDSYIVNSEPWKLAKDEVGKDKLDAVLCLLYRALRVTAVMIAPVMPDIAQKLWIGLGLSGAVSEQKFEDFQYEAPINSVVSGRFALFQRIDKDVVMNENSIGTMDIIEVARKQEASVALPAIKDIIDYDTFALVDLRVGCILTAERVAKSKKLIRMTIDIGSEVRVVLGGIGTTYTPEDLLDRKVILVANLAPRPIMGIMSHGMVLAASGSDSKPYLITPSEDAEVGFVVR